jgi:sulfite reductase (NADPH) flavoprotein alpha-component
MWRKVHRWPALVLGLLMVFLSATGAILAIDPVLRRFDRNVMDYGDLTVGEVLRMVEKASPNFAIDRVRVDYSGRIMLRGTDGGGSRDVAINLKTGRLARPDRPSPVMDFVRQLHTTLALGPGARPVTLATVLAMLVMLVTGTVLLARRLGGWRQALWPDRIRGRGIDKWHTVLGRLLVLPLFVTCFSGSWMALTTQGLLPNGAGKLAAPPETRVEGEMLAVADIAALAGVPVASLTELTWPIAADWWDVYTLRQGGTLTYVDRQSGSVLGTASVPAFTRVLDLMRLLHTGEGAAVWGAIAGLVALSVPFFTLTGVIIWLRRRQPVPRGLVRPALAEVAILVGSETGTTWGFAAHLAERLRNGGQKVWLGGMNDLPALAPAARILVLAATYGDGAPPSGAAKFLARLPGWTGGSNFAVLGFGDKSFPAYCAFAKEVDAALLATGRARLIPMGDVNRRSAQSFAAWGRAIGPVLGLPDLVLDYAPPRPRTRALVLLERQDFGSAAILRFAAKGRLPAFEAGDLLAVLPPADPVARLYSLASSRRDGTVDLCVARVEGGICSNFLMDLNLGENIDAHVEPNPDFRPAARHPTIMIGAGTGVAPFIGMIRANRRRRPMDLFFGLRHPEADFYWQDALQDWARDGQLAALYPAFSRYEGKTYVQDRLRAASAEVAERLRAGATVMVCGSVRMARAVAHEIDSIARETGLTTAELRASGRYLEDIY